MIFSTEEAIPKHPPRIMKSMTGYGGGRSGRGSLSVVVEVQSVNRKAADVLVNLPKEISVMENALREKIAAVIMRGRVVANVGLESTSCPAPGLRVDYRLASQYATAFRTIAKRSGTVVDGISPEALLRAPGVFTVVEQGIDLETARPIVLRAMDMALRGLDRMRRVEGRLLARDLNARVKGIKQALAGIRRRHPQVLRRYRESLLGRIRAAGLAGAVESERLAREVVFFADRADISEELTRLAIHLDAFFHALHGEEPVGRKLEFVLQEISREFNTLGSKANDAGISQSVVACKSELEKIREQIQNIE